MIKKVLLTLTKTWNHIAIMKENKDLSTLEIDYLIGSLMQHKERLKETEIESNKERSFASVGTRIDSYAFDGLKGNGQGRGQH